MGRIVDGVVWAGLLSTLGMIALNALDVIATPFLVCLVPGGVALLAMMMVTCFVLLYVVLKAPFVKMEDRHADGTRTQA
jgi:hypothetical protein